MSGIAYHQLPWPWNKLLTAHWPPLPGPAPDVQPRHTIACSHPTQAAWERCPNCVPSVHTTYYDEGRCPRCHERNPKGPFRTCLWCYEEDISEQASADRHNSDRYLKEADL